MTQMNADDAEKTRMSGVQLAAYQASSFERFTQKKKKVCEVEWRKGGILNIL